MINNHFFADDQNFFKRGLQSIDVEIHQKEKIYLSPQSPSPKDLQAVKRLLNTLNRLKQRYIISLYQQLEYKQKIKAKGISKTGHMELLYTFLIPLDIKPLSIAINECIFMNEFSEKLEYSIRVISKLQNEIRELPMIGEHVEFLDSDHMFAIPEEILESLHIYDASELSWDLNNTFNPFQFQLNSKSFDTYGRGAQVIWKVNVDLVGPYEALRKKYDEIKANLTPYENMTGPSESLKIKENYEPKANLFEVDISYLLSQTTRKYSKDPNEDAIFKVCFWIILTQRVIFIPQVSLTGI